MKKLLFTLFALFSINAALIAQSPETFLVPSVEFPDLQTVVDYINQNAPGNNGMTFNISGDNSFTEPHLLVTATGSASAPIVLQWDGTGSKPIVHFSGTSADSEAGITLEGTRYVTIEGLDIQNPDGLLEYGILLTNADETTGAQYNTVLNTHITLNKENPNQTNAIRAFPNHAQTSHEGTNSNNSFINNHVSNVLIAYLLNSNTGTVELMDTGNVVGVMDEGEHIIEDIVFCGVYLLNQNGATIDGTQILNLNRPDDGTNTAPASISTTGSLPSGELTNPIIISNNRIDSQYSSATSIFGMYLNQRNVHYDVYNNVLHNIQTGGVGSSYASGIFIFATGASANIYNNMVSGIAAPNSPGISARGIYIRTFNFVNLFYNSVLINYTSTEANNISTALSVHNINDPVVLRNNIFINKTTLPSGGTGFATAFLKSTASVANIQPDSDHNIYYAGTPSPQNLIFYGSSTAYDQTLAEFKARAVNFDQGSFTEDVPFLANDDLHVDPLAASVVRGNALPVAAPYPVTEDIDGMIRDIANPDIGADELAEAFPDVAVNPLPENGQTNIPVALAELQWEYHSNPYFVDPAGFNVLFGTSEELTMDDLIGWVDYSTELSSYAFDISNDEVMLNHSTNYYWTVIPSVDEIEGPEAENNVVWTFTTEDFTYDYPNPVENPQPENSAENISLDLDRLLWDYVYNDMFAEPAGFRVYLGTTEDLSEEDLLGWVSFDGQEDSYSILLEPAVLLFATDYFWKVVPTVDIENGPDAENVVTWTFTTEPFVHEFPNPAENPEPLDGDVSVSPELAELSWEYIQNEAFTLAEGFWVFLGTTPTLTDEDLLGWVSYDGNTQFYSILLNEEELLPLTQYYWEVVPSASMEDGPLAENVTTWQFTTDDGVSVFTPEAEKLVIYPNPATTTLYLSTRQAGLVQIAAMDGRIVLQKQITSLTPVIDISNLPEGSYVLSLIIDQTKTSRVIVIARR